MDDTRPHPIQNLPRLSTGETIQIAVKAYSRFILRLWLISMTFSSLSVFWRFLQRSSFYETPYGERIPLNSAYRIEVANSVIELPPIYGLPALFGVMPKRPLVGELHIFTNQSACYNISDLRLENKLKTKMNRRNEASSLKLTMIPRGDCSFDMKALNAQKAGFDAVIIYNEGFERDNSLFNDYPIRMAPGKYAKEVRIPVMHLTQSDAKQIRFASQHLASQSAFDNRPKLRIALFKRPFLTYRSLTQELLFQSLILLITVIFSASVVLSLSFIFLILQNVFKFGSPLVQQTIIQGSLILLDGDFQHITPKLRTIPFPETCLTPEDIRVLRNDDENRALLSRESCAICLEEFAIGNKARVLPCRHVFHTAW